MTFMKTASIFWVLIVGMVAFACDDDDDSQPDTTPAIISSTLVSGSWRVSYFQDRDDDETANFSGYVFNFTDAGVVIASKNATDIAGIWSTSESSSKVKLVVNFSGGSPLDELNEDWEVTDRSGSTIKLKHVSGGDGHIDYLTLQKN
jgi:hypothetical protein